MIVVTGGAGFIGSAFVWQCNRQGRDDVLVVDHLGTSEKWKNLVPLRFLDYLDRDTFLERILDDRLDGVEAIVHLGACSATTERDADYLMENNYRYTRHLAEWATGRGVRFVYASSAATYGDGALGFSDETDIAALRPLNMYGYSKHLFDLHARRTGLRERCAGIKFFNVFGPNEYQKGEMASVIYHAFQRIQEKGDVGLFQSYRPDYGDGEQKRDFIYVKDCVAVLWWLLERPDVNGLFNLGTGQARSWNDLARALFAALEREPKIEYIPMPDKLQGKYQYFTEARMDRLRAAGYDAPFSSLEEAVRDYVREHLQRDFAPLAP